MQVFLRALERLIFLTYQDWIRQDQTKLKLHHQILTPKNFSHMRSGRVLMMKSWNLVYQHFTQIFVI